MQKRNIFGTFTIVVLLAIGRCGGGSKSGEAAAGGDSGGGTTVTDATAPIVGTAIVFSGISDSGVTVSWGAASDSVTSAANLQYRLVRAATSAAIDTIAEVDAAAAGVTVIDDYTANLLTRNVSGLTATVTYFFAIVVRDAAGNKAIYAPLSATIAASGTTASPVFNPSPGTFGSAPNLQMTSATGGSIICYSTGASPVCNAGKTACTTGALYSTAIVVSTTATYKAIACKNGNTDSSETSGLYTIDTTAPTVASTTPANSAASVATGTTIAVTFSEAMTPSTIKAVTGDTSCLTNSPTVQVSTDAGFGTCIPMTSATPTTGDNITFTMTPSSTLSTATTYYIRVKTGVQDAVGNSLAAEFQTANGFTTALAAALTINTFTPASGTYNTSQVAAATTLETGSAICYTTNGVDPTAAVPGTCDTSFVNEGQTIPIGTSVTLKVLATKAGHTNSAVGVRTYSIVPIVTGTSPANAATGFDPFAGKINVTFSKAMKRSSATFNAAAGACTGNIQVSADNFTNCIGISIPAGDNSTFELTPAATLASATVYKVKVLNTLTDTSSNAVSAFEHTTGITTRYYRTETIDGTNNFVAGETFATSSGGYSTYVTWDNTYLYVGYSGADVSSGAATKWVLLYFGDSAGSSTGMTYNTQTPTFPTGFNAKYHLRWKANDTYTNAQVYSAAWADAAWDFTGDVFRTGSFVEFRIPRADIGSPSSVKLMVNMLNEQGGGEWTYGMAPSTGFTDGYAANPAKYLSCNLTSSSAPTTSCSILP